MFAYLLARGFKANTQGFVAPLHIFHYVVKLDEWI